LEKERKKSATLMKQNRFSMHMDFYMDSCKGWWRWQAKYQGCADER
jgi:hypothetical protein